MTFEPLTKAKSKYNYGIMKKKILIKKIVNKNG